MNRRLLLSLLDTHLDDLVERNQPLESLSHLTREEQAELASVAQLVEYLGTMLQPVTPNPAFRQELHAHLLAEAHDQLARRSWRSGLPPRPGKWTMAATASGLSVALGVVAVIAVARFRTDTA
jgi:hypothetical protein